MTNSAPTAFKSIARLVYNTGFNFTALILARLGHVLLFILVSRSVGPAEAGVLTVGLSYLAISGRFAAWGLDQILIREVADDQTILIKYLMNFLVIRFGLSICILILFSSLLFLFQPYSNHITWAILIITLSIFPEGVLNLCQAVFIAKERLEFVTLTGTTVGALKLGFGGVALFFGGSMLDVAGGLFFANMVAMVVAIWLVFKYFVKFQWVFNLQFCYNQLKIAAPFVIIAGAFIIDNQIDTLLVSWQLDEKSVGLYGAAIMLTTAVRLIPQAYRDAVFPRLASAFKQDSIVLQSLYRQSYKYLLIVGMPITVGTIVTAQPILVGIFGAEFIHSTATLQLLAMAAGLRFLGILHDRLMIIANWQFNLSYLLIIALVINISLNISLVPFWGIEGAAFARLLANSVVFLLTYVIIYHKIYAYNAIKVWVRPLVGVVVMFVALMLASTWHVVAQIILAIVVYGATLFMLKTFSRSELRLIGQIFRINQMKQTTSSTKE